MPGKIQVTLEQTLTRQGNALQNTAAKTAAAVNGAPWPSGGVWAYGVSFVNGNATAVPHALRRIPTGFLVVNQSVLVAGVPSASRAVQTPAKQDASQILLKGAGTFTGDVYIW